MATRATMSFTRLFRNLWVMSQVWYKFFLLLWVISSSTWIIERIFLKELPERKPAHSNYQCFSCNHSKIKNKNKKNTWKKQNLHSKWIVQKPEQHKPKRAQLHQQRYSSYSPSAAIWLNQYFSWQWLTAGLPQCSMIDAAMHLLNCCICFFVLFLTLFTVVIWSRQRYVQFTILCLNISRNNKNWMVLKNSSSFNHFLLSWQHYNQNSSHNAVCFVVRRVHDCSFYF